MSVPDSQTLVAALSELIKARQRVARSVQRARGRSLIDAEESGLEGEGVSLFTTESELPDSGLSQTR